MDFLIGLNGFDLGVIIVLAVTLVALSRPDGSQWTSRHRRRPRK